MTVANDVIVATGEEELPEPLVDDAEAEELPEPVKVDAEAEESVLEADADDAVESDEDELAEVVELLLLPRSVEVATAVEVTTVEVVVSLTVEVTMGGDETVAVAGPTESEKSRW